MDKEAKEGTEGGLLEPSLSHWLPPPVAPSGFQGISGAAVAVVGLHLEMATNGESRAPVLATSPPPAVRLGHQQPEPSAHQRAGSVRREKAARVVCVGANQCCFPSTIAATINCAAHHPPSPTTGDLTWAGPGPGRNAEFCLLFAAGQANLLESQGTAPGTGS